MGQSSCFSFPNVVTMRRRQRIRSFLASVAVVATLGWVGVSSAPTPSKMVIHVATNGSDSNSGTPTAPLATCAAAVKRVPNPIPDGGVEIQFSPGRYPLNANTSCGEVSFIGTAQSPVVFRGLGGPGSVVFDATQNLDTTAMGPVRNATIRKLLHPTAHDAIVALPVPVSAGWGGGQLEWNDVPLMASVWPNTGHGYVRKVFDRGAVYADGRTKGPKPRCTICQGSDVSTAARPCGANISLLEQPGGDWAAELEAGPGFGDLVLNGYLAADWYAETHHIAKVLNPRRLHRHTLESENEPEPVRGPQLD